jgi:hypothetical protein
MPLFFSTYIQGKYTLLIWFCSIWVQNLAAQVTPTSFSAEVYERHIDLKWEYPTNADASQFRIYKSSDGINYQLWRSVGSTIRESTDWTGADGVDAEFHYYIESSFAGNSSPESDTLSLSPQVMSDDEYLDMVQKQTIKYFWDFGHPVSGLARERNSSGDIVTMGGSGFGIMALLVGVERGWLTRAQVISRMIRIVSFLQIADKFHGVYPHWMNGATGKTIPFSTYDDGADLVETAFLMQGLICARQYFDQDNPTEEALRNIIQQLWEDVEWDWFRRNNSNVLYWHWSPNHDWRMNFQLRGFNETHITYILGAASPTHSIPGSLYYTGWAGGNYRNSAIHFGYPVIVGPAFGGPLFFSHYSYLGFDPRFLKDDFCNYFERNRNHTLINRAYCIANPRNHEGYSDLVWGLTASDNPWGYLAHDPGNDNGTIAPTAALSSMPYTPAESIATLKHFYRAFEDRLWGPYGFHDAFNLNFDWFADSYLAIDQGPIVVMIENHRSALLWDLFMSAPEIQTAIEKIGFEPDSTTSTINTNLDSELITQIQPNPVTGNSIEIFIKSRIMGPAEIQVYNVNSRLVSSKELHLYESNQKETIDISNLTSGNSVYYVVTTVGAHVYTTSFIKI